MVSKQVLKGCTREAPHFKPFVAMQTVLDPGKSGKVAVEFFTVTPQQAQFTLLREACGHPGEYVPPGDYVKLVVDDAIMMSDTRMEQATNLEFVRAARGSVLIAGLGLGMVLVPLLKKRAVHHVLVVEQSLDVIALVQPCFKSKKLLVRHGDIFEWTPSPWERFDTIYFDIWPVMSSENLKQMNKLHRRFAPFLASDGWMDSWCRKALRKR
jgi:hypothetical protein